MKKSVAFISALVMSLLTAVPAVASATTLPFSNVGSVTFTTTQVPSASYPVTMTITSTSGTCGTVGGPGAETADLLGPASQFVAGWGSGSSNSVLSGSFAGGTAAGSYTIKFNGSGCLATGTVTYT